MIPSGKEVLFAAIQMEQAGYDFYRALASSTDIAEVRRFCEDMAQEEARHLGTFRRMRDGLEEGSVRITESAQLARLAVNSAAPAPASVRKVAESGDVKAAVALAIGMEESSILFYRQLRELFPQQRLLLNAIISEEEYHLARLQAFPCRA